MACHHKKRRHRYPGLKLALLRSSLLASAMVCAGAGGLHAQSLRPEQQRHHIEPAKPLSVPPNHADRRSSNSTGFFVNEAGYLLTARHAVENCAQLTITKDQHRLAARVVAVSAHFDLALLKVARTLGLAAVFPRSSAASINDMVFAGAYDALTGLRLGGGTLANSRVVSSFGGSEEGHLVIDSPVTFGASGAPVLDKGGLVQGVVSRRTMVNRVLAVGAQQAKSFLLANGVSFGQDDRPQLAGSASRADRAASISVHVACLRS